MVGWICRNLIGPLKISARSDDRFKPKDRFLSSNNSLSLDSPCYPEPSLYQFLVSHKTEKTEQLDPKRNNWFQKILLLRSLAPHPFRFQKVENSHKDCRNHQLLGLWALGP